MVQWLHLGLEGNWYIARGQIGFLLCFQYWKSVSTHSVNTAQWWSIRLVARFIFHSTVPCTQRAYPSCGKVHCSLQHPLVAPFAQERKVYFLIYIYIPIVYLTHRVLNIIQRSGGADPTPASKIRNPRHPIFTTH